MLYMPNCAVLYMPQCVCICKNVDGQMHTGSCRADL